MCYHRGMTIPDLNLLIALDALLSECSVARAAARLQLSASATSRVLARLRETTGDPLLVRAGRGLVPTPRALELRDEAARLVRDAATLLRPAAPPDLARIDRAFTFRTREGFVETFGLALLGRIAQEAPGVRLHFVARTDKDGTALRDAVVDLETGVADGTAGPELRAQALFRDRFVAVVRADHALANVPRATPALYAAGDHVRVARRPTGHEAVDQALAVLGLERRVITTVASFPAALSLVRDGGLIATVPERSTGRLRDGLVTIPLPLPVPDITISLLWHPRMDADPVHRWLRGVVREVVGERGQVSAHAGLQDHRSQE